MLSAYPLAHILLSPQSFLKETFLSVDLLHTLCSRRTMVQSDLNLSQCTEKETQPQRQRERQRQRDRETERETETERQRDRERGIFW
jgi:hypothetical protein